MNLIREILEYIRDNYCPESNPRISELPLSVQDKQVIYHHLWLLDKAGFIINASKIGTAGSIHFHVGPLTWSGHDLLDKLLAERQE